MGELTEGNYRGETPDLVQKQEFLVGEWTETFIDQLSSLLTFLEGQSKSINKQ